MTVDNVDNLLAEKPCAGIARIAGIGAEFYRMRLAGREIDANATSATIKVPPQAMSSLFTLSPWYLGMRETSEAKAP